MKTNEEIRGELEGEFGPQVHDWTDATISRIARVRASVAGADGATGASEELEGRREAMLAAWKQDGGTEAEFAREWPGMRADIIRERARRREDERDRSAEAAARGAF